MANQHPANWNIYRTSALGGHINASMDMLVNITYTNIAKSEDTMSHVYPTFYTAQWSWRDCKGKTCISLGVNPVTGEPEPVVLTGMNQQSPNFAFLPLAAAVPTPVAAAMGVGLFSLVGFVHVIRRRRAG